MSVFYYYEKTWLEGFPLPVLQSRSAEGCPMPDCYLRGRPVYLGDAELNGVDSYFLDACYADSMEDLDDNELDEITDQEQDRLVTMNIEKYGWFKK